MADGLFCRDAPASVPGPPATASAAGPSIGAPPACPTFLPLPESPLKPLEQLFRTKVIQLLVAEKLLPPERVQVLYSWKLCEDVDPMPDYENVITD